MTKTANCVLGIDLGGTKIAAGLFTQEGTLLDRSVSELGDAWGQGVGDQIKDLVTHYLKTRSPVIGIGISVPGIYRSSEGTVWAPNIRGWENYPLRSEVSHVAGRIPLFIDSDRACGMLGELWKGSARGARHAIYLAFGTGIGAGILIDGTILRGYQDIAGAIGWMALDKPFLKKYIPFGCFEYYASGDGIARLAIELLDHHHHYKGQLKDVSRSLLRAQDVFKAYEDNDPLAVRVMDECIEYWGMAVANLISIFNPEKIIFGGGVFGPAVRFLDAIEAEAKKWAQPVSMSQVKLEATTLAGDAAIFGAAYLAVQNDQQ